MLFFLNVFFFHLKSNIRAYFFYSYELNFAVCEHVSTLSIGSAFVLGCALFLPSLWVLGVSSTAPKELLVAWGFFWSIYCMKPVLMNLLA